MKILIINGPNLNLLGVREPEIYGSQTMENHLKQLREEFVETEIGYFQSNSEGNLIDRLQDEDFDALVINPGAFSHYSYALADCLNNIQKPKIEVHISNIYQREEFRKKSVTAPYCDGLISGLGMQGYRIALLYIIGL